MKRGWLALNNWRFVNAAKKNGATLILVGDPEQLQPIQAGRPFKDIARDAAAAHLTEIRRQRQDWQRQASSHLAEGRCADAIGTYRQQGFVSAAIDTPEAIAKLAQDYVTDIELNGSDVSRLALTHRRKDVHAINQAIRSLRKSGGDLTVETLFQTDHGPRAFAAGDRIVFTRNDRDLGVKNGSFGVVEEIENGRLRVRLDTDDNAQARSITIMPDHYAAFDHGYACTIHKSQGATVDKAYVLGSRTMDHHLSYVAMTRHRDEMRLYGEPTALRRSERNHDNEAERPAIRQDHRHKRSGPRRWVCLCAIEHEKILTNSTNPQIPTAITPNGSLGSDPRESAETYRGELFRLGRYRVAICRDGIQWLYQKQRLQVSTVGGAWNTLGYCVSRNALARLQRAYNGAEAPEISALPFHINKGGAK